MIFLTNKDKFSELYNKHFTVKQLIRQRNKLQKLYAKWPLTYEATFKSLRNKVTSTIRSAKENYYKLS